LDDVECELRQAGDPADTPSIKAFSFSDQREAPFVHQPLPAVRDAARPHQASVPRHRAHRPLTAGLGQDASGQGFGCFIHSA
jgi:hypothetical protein